MNLPDGSPTLDIEQPDQLIAWLRQTGRITAAEVPTVRALAGGVSNRAVWVERSDGDAWVLKQALPKLRVAVDWFSSPERVHREALGMRWLHSLAPRGTITPLLFEDHTHHLIAMAAVPRPHANWKTSLLTGAVEDAHVRQFGALLGAIHSGALQRPAELRETFADRSFFEGLRLEPFYEYTAGRVPDAAPFLRQLAHQTRELSQTLVHGDYSPKNILIHQGRLVLLDHEVIHWGDPMFDIGFAIAHFLCKAHHLRPHRESFADATVVFWREYQGAAGHHLAGTEAQARAARHALGCLLARAAGRSQVEYLTPEDKLQQCRAVTALTHSPPSTILELSERFIGGIET
jgi:aminoglycoside phosphotransferase (APT) family kinase protein